MQISTVLGMAVIGPSPEWCAEFHGLSAVMQLQKSAIASLYVLYFM